MSVEVYILKLSTLRNASLSWPFVAFSPRTPVSSRPKEQPGPGRALRTQTGEANIPMPVGNRQGGRGEGVKPGREGGGDESQHLWAGSWRHPSRPIRALGRTGVCWRHGLWREGGGGEVWGGGKIRPPLRRRRRRRWLRELPAMFGRRSGGDGARRAGLPSGAAGSSSRRRPIIPCPRSSNAPLGSNAGRAAGSL